MNTWIWIVIVVVVAIVGYIIGCKYQETTQPVSSFIRWASKWYVPCILGLIMVITGSVVGLFLKTENWRTLNSLLNCGLIALDGALVIFLGIIPSIENNSGKLKWLLLFFCLSTGMFVVSLISGTFIFTRDSEAECLKYADFTKDLFGTLMLPLGMVIFPDIFKESQGI